MRMPRENPPHPGDPTLDARPEKDKLKTVVVGGEQVKIGALKAEKVVDLKTTTAAWSRT
jgi:hypothetical protein